MLVLRGLPVVLIVYSTRQAGECRSLRPLSYLPFITLLTLSSLALSNPIKRPDPFLFILFLLHLLLSLLVGKGTRSLEVWGFIIPNRTDEPRMSRRNGPKLELKLNLSPARANRHSQSPSRSATVSPTSPPSSCVSSELNQDEALRYSNSPEATSMVLVGCPRCLMYVMLSEDDPKCPKCKSTVLLDFLHHDTNSSSSSAATSAGTTAKKTRIG